MSIKNDIVKKFIGDQVRLYLQVEQEITQIHSTTDNSFKNSLADHYAINLLDAWQILQEEEPNKTYGLKSIVNNVDTTEKVKNIDNEMFLKSSYHFSRNIVDYLISDKINTPNNVGGLIVNMEDIISSGYGQKLEDIKYFFNTSTPKKIRG